MNCATCFARHLMSEGESPYYLGPSAVTVYHGEAMCKDCFVDELHAEAAEAT